MRLMLLTIPLLLACGANDKNADTGQSAPSTDPSLEEALVTIGALQAQLEELQQRLQDVEEQQGNLTAAQGESLVKESRTVMCETTEDGLAQPDESYWEFMAEAEQNNWVVSVSASPFRTCYNWETLAYEAGELVLTYTR